MPKDGRRVTAADVARSLGLSRATVGFVLNDTPGQTIPEATRERVLAEARRLGYRPHTAARALASGRSRIVLLVLPDWPMGHSLRTHIEEASHTLDRAGYSLVTMSLFADGRAKPLWETLEPEVVFALTPLSDEVHQAIANTGAKVISPGRDEMAALSTRLHYEDGPRLQIDRLRTRGARRIAFAGTDDPRLADLNARRCSLAEEQLRARRGEGLDAAAEVSAENARATVIAWHRAGIDGVAAYNDDTAALVLGAALREGIDVPAQLAIVGHDDTPLASLMVPALTTVRVDTVGLGNFMAALALSAIDLGEPPESTPDLDARLIVRESA